MEVGPTQKRDKLFDLGKRPVVAVEEIASLDFPAVVVEKPKNPFGLEKQTPQTVDLELTAKLEAQRLRDEQLRNDQIPVEEMTEGERTAYLLKHLKD